MFKQGLSVFFLSFVLLSPLHADENLGPSASSGGDSNIDLEPPVITHDPITSTLKAHQPLVMQVRITDDHGVFSATLFYRNAGAKEFRSLAMRISETDKDVFVIEIPAEDINPPKLEYYIQATDVSGNTVLRGGRLFPLSVAVESDFVPLAASTALAAAGSAGESNKGLTLNQQSSSSSSSKKMWYWIAGGAIIGALVAANSSGGDDTPPAAKPPSGTIIIDYPVPTVPQ